MIVTDVAVEIHPATFLTVTLYVPAVRLVKLADVWYVEPLMLYVNPVPVGAVIVILPVGIPHVGCTEVTTGVAGVAGAALIVTDVAVEIHPVAFLAVTEYVPATRLLNVADV